MPQMRDIGEYEVFKKKDLEVQLVPEPDELDLGDEVPDIAEDYNDFNGDQDFDN